MNLTKMFWCREVSNNHVYALFTVQSVQLSPMLFSKVCPRLDKQLQDCRLQDIENIVSGGVQVQISSCKSRVAGCRKQRSVVESGFRQADVRIKLQMQKTAVSGGVYSQISRWKSQIVRCRKNLSVVKSEFREAADFRIQWNVSDGITYQQSWTLQKLACIINKSTFNIMFFQQNIIHLQEIFKFNTGDNILPTTSLKISSW